MAVVGLMAIVVIVAFVLAASMVIATVGAVLGAAIWLVLLPIRLVFGIFKLAFLAVAGGLGLALFVVVGVVAGVALCLALLAPLLPIVLIGVVIWAIFRTPSRTARST